MSNREVFTTVLMFGMVVIVGMVIFGHCGASEECYRTVEDRPCLAGTVRYDGDGECECDTEHGELEWHVGHGCDMD